MTDSNICFLLTVKLTLFSKFSLSNNNSLKAIRICICPAVCRTHGDNPFCPCGLPITPAYGGPDYGHSRRIYGVCRIFPRVLEIFLTQRTNVFNLYCGMRLFAASVLRINSVMHVAEKNCNMRGDIHF